MRKELIEDYVIEQAIKSISDEDTLQKIIIEILSLFHGENAVLASLEQQLMNVQKSIKNVLKAVEEGLFTRTTKERLEELEKEEEQLKDHIEREKAVRPVMTEKMLRNFLGRYTHLDLTIPQNRERIVDELVGSILLFGDGRLILTLNYQDNPIQTALDEIIAAANNSSTVNGLASPTKKSLLSTDKRDFFE